MLPKNLSNEGDIRSVFLLRLLVSVKKLKMACRTKNFLTLYFEESFGCKIIAGTLWLNLSSENEFLTARGRIF